MDEETGLIDNQGAAVLTGNVVSRFQPPFHLRLPDVMPRRKVAPSPEAEPQKPALPVHQPEKPHPTDKSKTDLPTAMRIGKGRSDVDHDPSLPARDRVKETRRQLFDGLWIASILLTVVSVVALAVQAVQYVDVAEDSMDPESVAYEPQSQPPTRRKSPVSENRQIVRASSQVLANSPPTGAEGKPSVQSAHYTIDKNDKDPSQRGAWLEGTIETDDSDTISR